MSFIDELRKRNVIRIALLYAVVSWVALQVAELLFEAFELPNWSMRLVIVIFALGFPVALLFAWIFEVTPDGIRRESEGVANRSSGGRVNFAIAVFAALAIGIVAYDRLSPRAELASDTPRLAQRSIPGRSIAVLPFVNISDDPANIYFSEGLAEELLNLLAGIDELRVTARTSSFSFRDKDIDIPTIGKTLNVANVLEGSVRKSGNTVRVTAKLIDTEDGYNLWSQTYERTLDDVFAIQDEIAKSVVDTLRMSILGDVPTIRETAPEAYAAYLHALHFYQQRTPDGYDRAVAYTRQAIAIDSNYAPAWTLLSSAYSNMALIGAMTADESYAKAHEAVEKALQIDPDYALANSARAWMAMTAEGDYESAARFFNRALRLAPGSSIIIGNAAVFARTLGQVDRAIAMTEESLSLDPVSSSGYVNLSDQLYRAGRAIDAGIAASMALELTPGNDTARANLALSHLLAEQPEQAIRDIEPAEREFLQALIYSFAYASLGDSEQADVYLTTMIDYYSTSSAIYIASILAWRGEIDAAFEWLTVGVDEGQPMLGIRTDPFLRNLHDDERWSVLLQQLGLSDDQVAAIDF
jgi:adenylate cyclase